MTMVITAAERRRRLKLKRIVVSEQNYLVLKRLGHAGDSFNDVISKLLQIQRNYQEKQEQLQRQEQQESDDKNNSTSSAELPFPGSLSELFDEQDRQQLAGLLGLRRGNRSSRNNQTIKQAVQEQLPKMIREQRDRYFRNGNFKMYRLTESLFFNKDPAVRAAAKKEFDDLIRYYEDPNTP